MSIDRLVVGRFVATVISLLVVFSAWSCAASQKVNGNKVVNPLQYGLKQAKTGEDCYHVLFRTHQDALKIGAAVSYAGIKHIKLTIPDNAKSIPLTHYTDFAGVTIQVENKKKGMFLFTLSSKLIPVSVKGKEIDNGDFTHHPVLKGGNKLLVISDKTLWVQERIGYGKGYERKDIMLVEDGRGGNSPVQSYSTSTSKPDCYYCDVDVKRKNVIKNVTFIRTATSTEKTYFFKIENQYNVQVIGVNINTPSGSELYGDKLIYIVNCVDVKLKDISVRGTYSLPRQAGYGVSIHNIYNLYVENMYGRANWGVFGNHNVNLAYLKNCDINRFDVHCYGRDVKFENCNFVDLYNQFSGMYGEISFKNCVFTNCHPVLIEGSYNAFTPFDLYFYGCNFNFDEKHPGIVYFSSFSNEDNDRPELREKSLPNVMIKNCSVKLSGGLTKWYVFNIKKVKGYKGRFSYITKVEIDGLSVNGKGYEMKVYNNEVRTLNKVKLTKKR